MRTREQIILESYFQELRYKQENRGKYFLIKGNALFDGYCFTYGVGYPFLESYDKETATKLAKKLNCDIIPVIQIISKKKKCYAKPQNSLKIA